MVINKDIHKIVTKEKSSQTSASLMHEAVHSKPEHWDNQRDGRGRRWDGARDAGRMYTRGWFMSMYGENHHNIVKQLVSD